MKVFLKDFLKHILQIAFFKEINKTCFLKTSYVEAQGDNERWRDTKRDGERQREKERYRERGTENDRERQ